MKALVIILIFMNYVIIGFHRKMMIGLYSNNRLVLK
ncbi:hypothetical protein BLA29_011922 [Euroglyphus maynei]|uniref:Uncharacterized protein n=1 Tax=Euroglyphus maynei TaxID=6958 RepID=A0A1Y3BET4_EURMA|nr:hypothetical protein BLA29_011922 [Euroglyphus maynei]